MACWTLRRCSRSVLVRDDAVVVQRQLHESVGVCWFGKAVRVEAPRFARHTRHEESSSTRDEGVVRVSKRSSSKSNERIEDGRPQELNCVCRQEKRHLVTILHRCLADQKAERRPSWVFGASRDVDEELRHEVTVSRRLEWDQIGRRNVVRRHSGTLAQQGCSSAMSPERPTVLSLLHADDDTH